MRRLVPYVVLMLLALQPTLSLGRDASLASRVRAAHIVVVGQITHITRSKGHPSYGYDTGHIKATHVLKGSRLLASVVGQTESVPLSFPSIANALRVSTDIRYRKGQRGIFLLTRKNGRFVANHKDACQPISRLEEIEELVKEKLPTVPRPVLKKLQVVPPG